MLRNRFVAAVAAVVCVLAGVLAGVLVPGAAFAEQPSSAIARVEYARLATTDPHLVVVRLHAFDSTGSGVPFRGTVSLVDRAALVRPTSVQASAARVNRTVRVPIASRSGAPAVATVDVRRMKPSAIGLAVRWSLRRTRSAPVRTDTAVQRLIPLITATAADAARPGVRVGETIVRPVDSDAFTAYRDFAGGWPCTIRTLTFGRGVCVLHHRAPAAAAAGLGSRLTFTWRRMLQPDGTPYRRCLVLPELLRTDDVATSTSPTDGTGGDDGFDDSLAAPRGALGLPPEPTDRTPGLDVPGGWTAVTVPVGSLPGVKDVVPGTTRIRWTLACYDSAADRPEIRTETDLVPDLVPTRPAAVHAVPQGRALVLSAEGSRARGTAQVARYEAVLIDDRRTTARRVPLPAEGGASVAVRGLDAGRYRVVVRAINRVGASAARTVSVVVR